MTPARRFANRPAIIMRGVQLAAALALAAGLGGFVLSSGAGAQIGDGGSTSGTLNTNTFTISSQANALDVLVTDPSLPLSGDLNYELGPWGASSLLNSLGESISDAGAPYAPSIDSLPGTVNGLGAGDVPPLPPLPGYVSASYPNRPTNNQTQAGYSITSTAGASDAKGTVGLGVQPSGSPSPTFSASSEATANSDGSVAVTGSAGIDLLDFGQLLDLGNVTSTLSMTQQADQPPVVTSKTSLGTVTLLDQASGLVGKGVSVLGINTPLNLNTQVLAALNTLLSSTGIRFSYLPETFTYTDGTSSTGTSPNASKTLQAIDSGALQVALSRNIPSQGIVTVSLTLGRVYVSTMDSAFGGPSTSGSGGLDLGAGGSGTGLVGGISTGPSFGGSGVTQPTSGVQGVGTTTPPSQVTTPNKSSAKSSYLVEHGPPAQSIYLVLVLGALALLIGSQAMRLLAVRLALSGRPA